MSSVPLCHFIYKIISVTNRLLLSRVLTKILSPQQGAFISGRGACVYCVFLAQVHDLNRQVYGGNVILKLDMMKAYDRLEWSFLFSVLAFQNQRSSRLYKRNVL